MALTGSTNAEKIWNFCKSKGMTDCGCAGVLGNLDCESGLNPVNLEDQYQNKWGYTDVGYMEAVDSGAYTNFVRDESGWGICQWTWHTRKQELLNYARSCGASIGDLEMQLNFFMKELMEKFPGVLNTLRTATSVLRASNAMLLQFECPLNSGASVQALRASYSQKYYDRFVNKGADVKSTMGYYILAKGNNKKLSDNFTSKEFDCHGINCCTQTKINEQLVKYLQEIRNHFKTPITVTSGYRCPTHNSSPSVNGATGSRHILGDAADIVVANHTPKEVAQYAESIGIKGIGLYETNKDGHFVHIDTRTSKSFWYGQACAPRTTFGGANTVIAQPQKIVTNPQLLVCGSSGQVVKDMQEKLIRLGYDLGMAGADGEFGGATYAAVKKLQRENGLVEDGKVGSATMAMIDSLLKDNGYKEYIVTATALNVRSGAGTNFSVVKTVNKNTILSVFETRDGWGKIESGWVSMQYLREKG